jgi:chain length determinant protein (polysaccharide antigen chain regulator)
MADSSYELDIAAFLRELSKRWRILVGSFVSAAIIGVIYLNITAPVFRAESIVSPPSDAQIRSLELARIATGKINQSDVYQAFKRNIMSRHIQEEFLLFFLSTSVEENISLEFVRTSADGFNRRTRDYLTMETKWKIVTAPERPSHSLIPWPSKQITINVDADRTASRQQLVVTLDWSDIKKGMDMLDGLVKHANNYTVEQLTLDAEEQITTRILNIQSTIAHKKRLFANLKKDRLLVLEEAASIAGAIGAEKPIDALSRNIVVEITPPAKLYTKPADSELQPAHILDITTYLPLYQVGRLGANPEEIISSRNPPLYTRGSEALQAEIAALKLRKSDEPFIPDLTRLKEELNWLEHITIDQNQVTSINQDIPVRAVNNPIHPRPLLILSLIFGMALLLFITITSLSLFFKATYSIK